MPAGDVTLFLSGDVMLGRGVDQILPHPGDPALQEGYIQDARGYVDLAEEANGPIPRPVDPRWPWGDALKVLDEVALDARVINLETSVTTSDDFAPGKRVHYRMHPDNLDALTASAPDVTVLANNHVLDFGVEGLEETLDSLMEAGLTYAGAGRDDEEAHRPASVALDEGRRVLVFAIGMPSSGVPAGWAATEAAAGVAFVARASDRAAAELGDRIERSRRPGDIVVVSVHWGSNWGYWIPDEQTRFAHALIDAGTDVVHGHSSHHPRPVEVHRGRPILYGCGDLINDYEGIRGHEGYRDELRLLYLVSLDRDSGVVTDLRMVPLKARRMRLEHAPPEDSRWLRDTLHRSCRSFGTRVAPSADGDLILRWS